MTPPAPAARRPSAALLWVLLAAMGAGPLFNYGVSASSTVVMERLDVTSGQLGTVMTVVFAAAAVTSLGLGRAADRLSARAQLSIIFGGTAAALVLGAVAPSLPVLYAAAAVAGVTQAISNPTTNRIIRTVVPPERRIGWVGVKQSGVQAAQLVGGLFFPAASLALGWTGAALGAAVLIGALWVLALVAAPPLPGAPPQSFRPERTPSPGSPTPPGPSLGTKSCAHRSASVGPSGDDGAAITAEAGPRPRCTASSCWANACPRGTSTVRWPSSKSGSRS